MRKATAIVIRMSAGTHTLTTDGRVFDLRSMNRHEKGLVKNKLISFLVSTGRVLPDHLIHKELKNKQRPNKTSFQQRQTKRSKHKRGFRAGHGAGGYQPAFQA